MNVSIFKCDECRNAHDIKACGKLWLFVYIDFAQLCLICFVCKFFHCSRLLRSTLRKSLSTDGYLVRTGCHLISTAVDLSQCGTQITV